jgi:hypothetical protein
MARKDSLEKSSQRMEEILKIIENHFCIIDFLRTQKAAQSKT